MRFSLFFLCFFLTLIPFPFSQDENAKRLEKIKELQDKIEKKKKEIEAKRNKIEKSKIKVAKHKKTIAELDEQQAKLDADFQKVRDEEDVLITFDDGTTMSMIDLFIKIHKKTTTQWIKEWKESDLPFTMPNITSDTPDIHLGSDVLITIFWDIISDAMRNMHGHLPVEVADEFRSRFTHSKSSNFWGCDCGQIDKKTGKPKKYARLNKTHTEHAKEKNLRLLCHDCASGDQRKDGCTDCVPYRKDLIHVQKLHANVHCGKLIKDFFDEHWRVLMSPNEVQIMEKLLKEDLLGNPLNLPKKKELKPSNITSVLKWLLFRPAKWLSMKALHTSHSSITIGCKNLGPDDSDPETKKKRTRVMVVKQVHHKFQDLAMMHRYERDGNSFPFVDLDATDEERANGELDWRVLLPEMKAFLDPKMNSQTAIFRMRIKIAELQLQTARQKRTGFVISGRKITRNGKFIVRGKKIMSVDTGARTHTVCMLVIKEKLTADDVTWDGETLTIRYGYYWHQRLSKSAHGLKSRDQCSIWVSQLHRFMNETICQEARDQGKTKAEITKMKNSVELIIGRAKFRSSVPLITFRKKMAKYFHVVMVSEYNTSQRCAYCLHRLELYKVGKASKRLWICNKCNDAEQGQGATESLLWLRNHRRPTLETKPKRSKRHRLKCRSEKDKSASILIGLQYICEKTLGHEMEALSLQMGTKTEQLVKSIRKRDQQLAEANPKKRQMDRNDDEVDVQDGPSPKIAKVEKDAGMAAMTSTRSPVVPAMEDMVGGRMG
eukprot:TRINITY_DN668_c0_g1_i2.p1 TRINITY_DN668_c0_g1~~TRINITY_DN668_c0_g1_i2.p1  ORF type:complete len:774 (-),score=176.25 TRINITY_DN668_c0_g1_i2:137-2458(-)